MRVSMGNYESLDIGATYTLDSNDIGMSNDDVLEYVKEHSVEELFNVLVEECERGLNQLLIQEVRDAQALTDNQKSFLLVELEPRTPKPPKHSRR